MSVKNRLQAFSATRPFSMNKKIDLYLSDRLPDLMDEYKIAVRADISDIDKNFIDQENRMDQLEVWKDSFKERTFKAQNRVDRLKKKFDIEGGG
jgi:hypothetical protein